MIDLVMVNSEPDGFFVTFDCYLLNSSFFSPNSYLNIFSFVLTPVPTCLPVCI